MIQEEILLIEIRKKIENLNKKRKKLKTMTLIKDLSLILDEDYADFNTTIKLIYLHGLIFTIYF